MAYDMYGGPMYVNSGNGRPGRRAQRYPEYEDDPRRYYPRPQQMPMPGPGPAQIIINNENHVDEHEYYDPPPRPVFREPQQQFRDRVFVDQQIVRVRDRSRDDRDRDDRGWQARRDRDELERLQMEQHEHELREKIKQDLAAAAAKEKQDEIDRIEKEKMLKEKAIEEWKAKEEKEAQEKKEKEKEKEEIGKEYMRQQLKKDGYTDEEITELMERREKKKRTVSPSPSMQITIKEPQPFVMLVSLEHVDIRSLEYFGYSWEYHDKDGYVRIYHKLSRDEQDELFEHTAKLKKQAKGQKLIEFARIEEPIVHKGYAKDRQGRLLMVRKPAEARPRSRSRGGVTKRFFM